MNEHDQAVLDAIKLVPVAWLEMAVNSSQVTRGLAPLAAAELARREFNKELVSNTNDSKRELDEWFNKFYSSEPGPNSHVGLCSTLAAKLLKEFHRSQTHGNSQTIDQFLVSIKRVYETLVSVQH